MKKERRLSLVLLLILIGLTWSFFSTSLIVPFLFLIAGTILLLQTIFSKE